MFRLPQESVFLLQLRDYALLPQSSICVLIGPLICVSVVSTMYVSHITRVMYHNKATEKNINLGGEQTAQYYCCKGTIKGAPQ
jgi:hypothetical protein